MSPSWTLEHAQPAANLGGPQVVLFVGLFGNNRARFAGFDFPALELPVGEERPAGSSWPKSSFLLLDTFLLMSGRHVSGPPTCRPSMAWPSCRATARTWARGRSRKPRLAPATRARPVSILAANHGEPVQTFATKLWFHWPQHASCSMLGPRQVRHCLPCVCLLAENSLLRAHSRPKRSPAGETVSDPLTPRETPPPTTLTNTLKTHTHATRKKGSLPNRLDIFKRG